MIRHNLHIRTFDRLYEELSRRYGRSAATTYLWQRTARGATAAFAWLMLKRQVYLLGSTYGGGLECVPFRKAAPYNRIDMTVERAGEEGERDTLESERDEALAEATRLRDENAAMATVCREMRDALVAYETTVDEAPPYKHQQMVARADALLGDSAAVRAAAGIGDAKGGEE